MRISTTTRYSIIALVDIAAFGSGEPVSVSTISERQGIPVAYLEQLFLKLRKSNLIKSVKGFNGGFLLKRAAKDITVEEVIKAVEGHVAPIYRTKIRTKVKINPKDKNVSKITEKMWVDFGALVVNYFSGITIEKLANSVK